MRQSKSPQSINLAALVVIAALCGTTSCSTVDGRERGMQEHWCELRVVCKASVKETVYVDVISGGRRESFGVVGAGPNGRDGAKTTAASPIGLDGALTVKWGVKGADGLRQENETIFDMRPYRSSAERIRAIELVFHGGKKWEIKVYDASIANRERKEIKPSSGY
jgi:hypothetical protein